LTVKNRAASPIALPDFLVFVLEWRWAMLTHNLTKLHRHQIA